MKHYDITRAEKEVLEAIRTYLDENVMYPTYSDLSTIANKKKTNINLYLNKLEMKGYIKVEGRLKHTWRKKITITSLGNSLLTKSEKHEN